MRPGPIEAFGHASGIYDFMNSAWGWPFIESLHYISLALLLGTVGLFDLRMLGVAKSVPLKALHRFVPIGICAYIANVCTGSLFFVSVPDQYLYNPSFQLKLACMAVAGVNVTVFYSTIGGRVKALGNDDAVPLMARVIAIISLASWTGVIIFGRLITYFRPPYHWEWW
jgi:uncharacterized protein DUF6644